MAAIGAKSPAVRAARETAAQTAPSAPMPERVDGGIMLNRLVTDQTVALCELSSYAVDAARYLGQVAIGRKRGEQWRMRAAESVLDRTGVTGDTVARAQIVASEAARAESDIAPLLARLIEARTLAQRRESAVDATQQPGESGQNSGTPTAA